ncbi:glycosyltransferase 87 family protein [Kribbella sp. NPDC004536]|uniref:glycosyltransferase 87 family protein n=1 Tax=Kribbella sp. NPDC004536 TaxID=3364106 RepID=UPI0036959F9A
MAALAGVALCVLLPGWWDHTGADLKVYRLGGHVLLTDPSMLYWARPPGMSLPFTYPPFAGLVFVPFALLPWPLAYGVSIAGSVAALWVIVRYALQHLFGRVHPGAMLAAVAGCVLLEPVRETLAFGQINLALCALIMYDLLDTKHRHRGIWTGIAAGIKLTPLVFLALLLVTRQWRALKYAGAAFCGTLLIGFVTAPRASVQYWTRLVFDSGRIGPPAYAGNQSWNGLFVRLGAPSGGTVWLIAVTVTVILGLWLSQRLHAQGQPLASVSVGATIALLCAPISWDHHWVWAVPLGAALTAVVPADRPIRRAAVAAVWYGFFIVAPYRWLPIADGREYAWTLGQQVIGNGYLLAALLACTALRKEAVRVSRPSVSPRRS